MTDLFSKFDALINERAAVLSTGVRDPFGALRLYRVSVIRDLIKERGDLPLVEPSAVESLMFIPPHEAGAIFGADASGGVLIINTRQTRKR